MVKRWWKAGAALLLMGALVTGPALAEESAIREPGLPPDVQAEHWAKDAVKLLVEKGIIQLTPDGKFQGKKNISRYETAVVLARAMQELEKENARMVQEELPKKADVEQVAALEKTSEQQTADLQSQQKLVKALAGEIVALKKNDDRIGKLEKAKSIIDWNGNIRMKYQTTDMDDGKGGNGKTTRNTSTLRLDGKAVIDPSMFVFFRVRWDQSVRRNGDSDAGATDRFQYLYIDKKDLWGGDWRLGRQYGGIGNNMLFVDYYDGVTHTRKINDRWAFKGIVLSQNTYASADRSSGLEAAIASVDWKAHKNHLITLSHFENNAKTNKFGVITPNTREEWASVDFKGTFSKNWSYFATLACYENGLDKGNTLPTQKHLRGDTDNTGRILSVKYEEPKKWALGAHWAEHKNNFRVMDVLNDLFYLDIPYSPLEDTLNILSQSAYIIGKDGKAAGAQTILPPNAAAAAPLNTPLPINSAARGTENRPGGAYLGDIHGYQDLQILGKYHFRDNLFLQVAADWLKPVKGAYNYGDITGVTARLRYKYTPINTFELRVIHATSEYGRSLTDARVEYYMKFK